jgi:hypothetical protein
MNAPVKTSDRLAHVVHFDPREIRRAVGQVEGFNAKLALIITRTVGTMACAYAFAILALISLPDAIKAGRPAIISWIAQTFLQLVLLSIIMVGQSVQSAASDARAAKEFSDTETILDRLDTHTAGGPREVFDAIGRLGGPAGGSTPAPREVA